jgi:hypothetical protein
MSGEPSVLATNGDLSSINFARFETGDSLQRFLKCGNFAAASRVAVRVIRTDKERMIARSVYHTFGLAMDSEKRFPPMRENTYLAWIKFRRTMPEELFPLANLAFPALRHLRPDEVQQFSQALRWLIESDKQIEILEFVLQKIVRRHLAGQLGGNPKPERTRT